MPNFYIISASGTTQRQMLETVLEELNKKGYTEGTRQEGGEWSEIISDSLSGGLFDDKRYILVESATLLGELPEKYEKFVSTSPDESVAIILVYGDDAKATHTKFFSKEILKSCNISKPAPFPVWANERVVWVLNRSRELGINMARDGAQAIVDSLDSPEEIAAVLQNFRGFDKPITQQLVSDLVLDDGSKNSLRLIDSLCMGQVTTCMKAFHALAKDDSQATMIQTLAMLENRLRLCLLAKEPDNQVYARAVEAKKNYAWKMARACAAKYSAQSILKYLSRIIAISVTEKSGTGGGWQGFELATAEFLAGK